MAQKRMLDKKISVSEQVAELPLVAQLIFTWSIPHADDLGLLPSKLRTLKAMLIPMLDVTVEDFGNHVETILSAGLWEVFESDGEKYFKLARFADHQTLKKDRKPNTLLGKVGNWTDVEKLGFQMEDIGNLREGKLREVKGSKEKEGKPESSLKFLKEPTDEFIGELFNRFDAPISAIRSKLEDLVNYCDSKGKRYANYHSFALNAFKRDFKERKKVYVPDSAPPQTKLATDKNRGLREEMNRMGEGLKIKSA